MYDPNCQSVQKQACSHLLGLQPQDSGWKLAGYSQVTLAMTSFSFSCLTNGFRESSEHITNKRITHKWNLSDPSSPPSILFGTWLTTSLDRCSTYPVPLQDTSRGSKRKQHVMAATYSLCFQNCQVRRHVPYWYNSFWPMCIYTYTFMYCIHIFILIQLGLLDSDMSCLYISIQMWDFWLYEYTCIHVHYICVAVSHCITFWNFDFRHGVSLINDTTNRYQRWSKYNFSIFSAWSMLGYA